MLRRERETLQKLILVPYRPFRNLSLGIGGVILLVLSGFGGFWAGVHYTKSTGVSIEDARYLRSALVKNEKQESSLQEALNVAKHEREMILATTEQLRQDNKKMIETVADLEDQIAVYKRLLSPKVNAGIGIQIDSVQITKTDSATKFQYRLMLTNTNLKVNQVMGDLLVRVIGAGKSYVVPVGDNHFNFQYFQSLNGVWDLPAGFQPERVDILVKPQKLAPLQKSFPWVVR